MISSGLVTTIKRWIARNGKRIGRFIQYWGEDVDFSLDKKADALRSVGVQVGDNSALWNVSVDPIYPELISIGSNVTITNSTLLTHDDSSVLFTKRRRAAPIKIGNNVFVGWNTIILPGVTIGNNCIIGAGSIVAQDIPDNSVAAGVPAKVIKTMAMHIESLYANPSLLNFEVASSRVHSNEHNAMKQEVMQKYREQLGS